MQAANNNRQEEEFIAAKNSLQKELDFMSDEQNKKELFLSDMKTKLKKRSDELNSLKEGLNSQIS